jgi:hypothetical protein
VQPRNQKMSDPPSYGIRNAATIYKYLYQLIYNRLTKKNQPASNIFIFQQKI